MTRAPAVPTPVSRRRWLQDGGALVLLLTGPQLVHGATILAVRVWPAAEYTRVTVESDEPLRSRHFTIDGPPRLVIDIDGLELSPELRELLGKVAADDPYIARVRLGQTRPRVVRVVFDLKQPSAPQVFSVPPVAAYRHRLVFDLYPLTARDPLLALAPAPLPGAAGDAVQAEQAGRAASAVDDAMGAFLSQLRSGAAPSGTAAVPGPLEKMGPAARAGLRPPSSTRKAPSRGSDGMDRLIIVALDPGHGGEDPGAIGPRGLREKDVVLQIALQLRDRINAVPNMRAMLTRDADYFVPLDERVSKARRVQADLFISIHADAFFSPRARGASVFTLSQRGASSAAARWIAQRENSADTIGGINIRAKDQNVLRTLLDMSTAAQIADSLKLGEEVLGHIGRVGTLHKEKVEQAAFAVLKAPDVPSILVETAFISNPQEEAKLRSKAYQRQLVDALMSGITRYFEKNPPVQRQRTL